MNEDDRKAKQYRDEAKQLQSPTPSPAQREQMRKQAETAKRDAQEAKAAREAPTTRNTPGFVKGGALKAKINRQDTRHGKMDMPFTSLKRFVGKKAGGRVRRFSKGGDFMDGRPFAETEATEERTTTRRVDDEPSGPSKSQSGGSADFKRAFAKAMAESKESGAKSFEYKGKSYALEYKKPSKDYEGESDRMKARAPRTETKTETVPTPAVTGRADKASKNMPSDEQKAENTRRLAEGATTALGLAGIGRGITAVLGAAGRRAASSGAMEKAAEGTRKAVDAKNLSKVGKANEARFNARRAAERAADRKESGLDAQRASDMADGFRKGGNVKKYMKGGKVKEGRMEMRHAAAMKKAGLPKSMVQEERSEAMKYAKGGGIEARGKTKGTVIKMASGGSVRGSGCETRGKTKGRMV